MNRVLIELGLVSVLSDIRNLPVGAESTARDSHIHKFDDGPGSELFLRGINLPREGLRDVGGPRAAKADVALDHDSFLLDDLVSALVDGIHHVGTGEPDEQTRR